MNKKALLERIKIRMKKKDFPFFLLNIIMVIAFVVFSAAVVMFICYDCYGDYSLLKDARELTYSAIGTVSIGICSYYCFKNMKTKENK